MKLRRHFCSPLNESSVSWGPVPPLASKRCATPACDGSGSVVTGVTAKRDWPGKWCGFHGAGTGSMSAHTGRLSERP